MAETPASRLKRLAARAGFYAALFGSLFVFPSALPWMMAGWILAAGVRAWRGLRAWPPLVFCVAIVLVKRVDWPPALLALLAVMAALAIVDHLRRREDRFAFPVVLAAWVAMAWTWHAAAHTSRRPELVRDRPIVCLGDSLTAHGWPLELRRLVSVPVINQAVGGIETRQAVSHLQDLVAIHPQVVIIELGGHDYLKGRSRAETKANLEEIIQAARGAGAEVVLFEIPRGFITDPFGGLDRELAREHDLELVGDGAIRSLVFLSPLFPLGSCFGRLSDDGLHPNAQGHVFLAGRVLDALRSVYGDAVLARPRPRPVRAPAHAPARPRDDPLVLSVLQDLDRMRRWRADPTIPAGGVGHPEYEAALQRVRDAAPEALHYLEQAALERGENVLLRVDLVNVVAGRPGEETRKFLAALFADPEEVTAVRLAALSSLSAYRDAETVELLRSVFEDPAPFEGRYHVCLALGASGRPEALAALRAALAPDRPSDVRCHATLALGGFTGDASVREDLRRRARFDANPLVRQNAVRALARSNAPDVAAFLRELASGPEGDLRRVAEACLRDRP